MHENIIIIHAVVSVAVEEIKTLLHFTLFLWFFTVHVLHKTTPKAAQNVNYIKDAGS
jgi:hypothetical protein